MSADIFWMVYGDGKSAPTARHATKFIAETESKRLARNNPGVKFFVLETVGVAEKIDVQFTTFTRREIDDSEIPF